MSGAPDTVVEAITQLRERGYTAELVARADGLHCVTCGTDHEAHLLVADHVDRFEGMSDPGDEAIVVGVTCPVCGAKGVVVSAYGPDADPDELRGILMIAARYAGG